MKTKPANILVTVQAAVASATEEKQFRLWFDNHAMREFETWNRRNKFNKPRGDLYATATCKRMSG